MSEKRYYRDYFARVQKYVKLYPILKDLGIARTSYYNFVRNFDMKHDNLSISTLKLLYDEVRNILYDLYE